MSVIIEPPYPPIDQNTIILKLKAYLEMQTKRYPEKYKNTEALIASLTKGQCVGFSALWLYAKSEEKLDKLYSLLKEVSNWDEKEASLRAFATKRNPDGRLAATFEQLLNDVQVAYEIENIMAWPLKSNYLEQMHAIVKEEGVAPIINEFSMSFVFKKKN